MNNPEGESSVATKALEPARGKSIRKSVESVRLRTFHQFGDTPQDDIEAFLQSVDWATRADISGATRCSWASVDGVLKVLVGAGYVTVNETVDPWEYRWK